jgi:hypothetical protein
MTGHFLILYYPLREEGVEGGGTGLLSTSRSWCRPFLP